MYHLQSPDSSSQCCLPAFQVSADGGPINDQLNDRLLLPLPWPSPSRASPKTLAVAVDSCREDLWTKRTRREAAKVTTSLVKGEIQPK